MEKEINNKFKLKENERLDDLQRDGLMIIQNPDFFCFGIDAVLLSEFARVKPMSSILDLCSGNGIIPLLLKSRYNPKHIDAVEILEENCSMANRSVIGNGLQDVITIHNANLNDACGIFQKNTYDAVTVNPPYIKNLHGLKNPNTPLAYARHEVSTTLDDIVSVSSSLLKSNGKFFMIHKPFRLVEIFDSLTAHKLEPKRLRFIHSKAGTEPSLCLIEAVKGGGRELRVMPPLYVYDDSGNYTEEVYRIYGYVPN